jgi:hypothetical protein
MRHCTEVNVWYKILLSVRTGLRERLVAQQPLQQLVVTVDQLGLSSWQEDQDLMA